MAEPLREFTRFIWWMKNGAALRHHWLLPISCHFRDCKIIIIMITKTMFMVLSSWQSHCESSPGSFDEWRMAPSGHRPKTKPVVLGCECLTRVSGATASVQTFTFKTKTYNIRQRPFLSRLHYTTRSTKMMELLYTHTHTAILMTLFHV